MELNNTSLWFGCYRHYLIRQHETFIKAPKINAIFQFTNGHILSFEYSIRILRCIYQKKID